MSLYAHVRNATITQIGALPRIWNDGTRDWDFRPVDLPGGLLASLGWFPIALTPRPADTATDTYVEDVALVGGLPVQTWTPRPWTADELAARAEQATAEAKAVEDRAILDAIARTSASAHADGETWTAPTGAHDAYALGVTVKHAGKTWLSLIPANVWAPGVTGWREVVAEGPAAWVQPLGAHDAYPLGAKVTHKGKTWTSTAAANVWRPGVYGWA